VIELLTDCFSRRPVDLVPALRLAHAGLPQTYWWGFPVRDHARSGARACTEPTDFASSGAGELFTGDTPWHFLFDREEPLPAAAPLSFARSRTR
jgi:hypothetical protein